MILGSAVQKLTWPCQNTENEDTGKLLFATSVNKVLSRFMCVCVCVWMDGWMDGCSENKHQHPTHTEESRFSGLKGRWSGLLLRMAAAVEQRKVFRLRRLSPSDAVRPRLPSSPSGSAWSRPPSFGRASQLAAAPTRPALGSKVPHVFTSTPERETGGANRLVCVGSFVWLLLPGGSGVSQMWVPEEEGNREVLHASELNELKPKRPSRLRCDGCLK